MQIHQKMQGEEKPLGDPYEELANAIIIQAAKDYVHAIRGGYKDRHKKQSLERFFRSNLFRILTNTDPEWLISHLQAAAKRERRDR